MTAKHKVVDTDNLRAKGAAIPPSIKTTVTIGDKYFDDLVYWKPFLVDWNVLANGAQYLLLGKDVMGRSISSSETVEGLLTQDAGCIDAIGADVLVQLGVFGQMIFG